MWQALLIVVVAVVGSGLLLKGWGRLVRSRARRRLGPDKALRHISDVTMRVLVQSTGALTGMSPRAANRTRGDLTVMTNRLLVACNRGVLVDDIRGRGRGLRSVRSTGPGKLVIEGDTARPGRAPALWRIEVGGLDGVTHWVDALRPWVRDVRTPGGSPVSPDEHPG
jgi:hypothetical protein